MTYTKPFVPKAERNAELLDKLLAEGGQRYLVTWRWANQPDRISSDVVAATDAEHAIAEVKRIVADEYSDNDINRTGALKIRTVTLYDV